MIYVFDTNTICVLKNYYPKRFPSLWTNLNGLVGTIITSVAEVHRELDRHSAADFLDDWIKENKGIFHKPCIAEQKIVGEIFAVPHFQNLISQKALLEGTPVADPFVIASAKYRCGTVVTEEVLKPNAAKIPNVCGHFDIPCINLETFMDHQGWKF